MMKGKTEEVMKEVSGKSDGFGVASRRGWGVGGFKRFPEEFSGTPVDFWGLGVVIIKSLRGRLGELVK